MAGEQSNADIRSLVDDEPVYDDAGNIYFDPVGRLRDKADADFFLPKLSTDKEVARLHLLGVVNRLIRESNDELPHAKVTYARLRSEGAGDLEARSLMAGVWMEEIHECVKDCHPANQQRMIAKLDQLKPYARSGSERVRGELKL